MRRPRSSLQKRQAGRMRSSVYRLLKSGMPCLYVVDGATAPPSVPPAADPPPSVSYTLEVVLVSPVLAELDDAAELAADIDGEEDAESGEKARVQLWRRTKRLVGSTRTRDESRAW
ncbi:hypothetical protein CONPUDRAFT_148302 [Coniophora puteana RWD-64-598 SS2]|uniref:Uncharacterized protein n=1 Tax=Coniophora puteana (strain RWD-64-598) TaxID=741705 RepID=A0A5M3N5R1_CONPW|nr:uncharacterized protein CONPUDRAFT_148302 [Coniophora puteana RWD-64-598 SS2]EIW86205.1 hypothetical protein CONPUDRAFT_148302 [Coniophora puteana RWD-64-598 SS2]